MGASEADLIETLLRENEEFRKAKQAHSDFARQLDQLEQKPYLTPQDEMEIKVLKKKKLYYKDQMEKILIPLRKETAKGSLPK